MTYVRSPLFEEHLIECIGGDREPGVVELEALAARIWRETQVGHSLSVWEDLDSGAIERVSALRAAHLALCGDSEVHGERLARR